MFTWPDLLSQLYQNISYAFSNILMYVPRLPYPLFYSGTAYFLNPVRMVLYIALVSVALYFIARSLK